MSWLRRYAFFLVMLPLFVVIHLEKELHQLIRYQFVYDRLLIMFLVPMILTGLLQPYFRNWKKSALMGLLASLPVFFLGDLKNTLEQKAPDAIWGKYSFLFTVSLLLLLLIARWIKRKQTPLNSTFFFLNILLLLFIMADLSMIAGSATKGRYRMETTILENGPAIADSSKPDIYYIIFDAYAASSTLQQEFGMDNAPVENKLKAKGFQVISGSRSNYNYTAFSLSSVFHLQYMANVDTAHKVFDREYLQALKTVQNNPLFPFLEKEGYQIFNHSLFDINRHPTSLAQSDKWGIRELYDQYNILFKFVRDLNHRLPGWMTNRVMHDRFFVNEQENRSQYDSLVYEGLISAAKSPDPRPCFVYAHFLTPHPPFHLDSLGHPFQVPPVDIRDGYRHQVRRINGIIDRLTDSLLRARKRPLVIILQGDHGYTTVTDKVLKKERMFPNFQAWYYSNGDYGKLPADLTNVNTFRIVLNTWFRKELPILHNEFYFIK